MNRTRSLNRVLEADNKFTVDFCHYERKERWKLDSSWLVFDFRGNQFRWLNEVEDNSVL